RLRHAGRDRCMGATGAPGSQFVVGQTCDVGDPQQLWSWQHHRLVHQASGLCLELEPVQPVVGTDPGTNRTLPAGDPCDGAVEWSLDGLTPCEACTIDCSNGERVACSQFSNRVCQDIAPGRLV